MQLLRIMKASSLWLGVVISYSPIAAEQPKLLAENQGFEAALQAVVRHHPAVKGKLAELEAQDAAVESAKAARYPTVQASADNLDDEYNQGSLVVSQPLWAFGKIDRAIDEAKANYQAEELSLLQVQRQLLEETAAAYTQLENIQLRLKVAQENISEHKRLHERIQRREQGQLASKADVHLAYSRLIQAQADLYQLKGDYETALNELKALTQIAIKADEPVAREWAQLETLPRVKRDAIAQSAEVKYKRELLNVADHSVKRQEVAWTPTVSFQAKYNFLDVTSEVDETQAGIVIEGTIEGMGFSSVGQVRGALARKEAARQDVQVTINDIERRVTTLMLNRRVQSQLRDSQQAAVDAVAETMASYVRQYETGRKSWLEVLNTQRELTQLRYQLIQVDSDWLTLSLRIAALTGQLDPLAGIKSL